MRDDLKFFETKDLGVSAILLSYDIPLVRTAYNGKEVYFYFDNKEEAERLAHQYNFGGLMVQARKFHDSMILIKREILARYNPKRFKKETGAYATPR